MGIMWKDSRHSVVVARYVTVPFQLKEMELLENFSFMGTGDVDQFLSSVLEMVTSSFHPNRKRSPFHFI